MGTYQRLFVAELCFFFNGQAERQVVSEKCRPGDFWIEADYYGQAERQVSLWDVLIRSCQFVYKLSCGKINQNNSNLKKKGKERKKKLK